MELSWLDFEFSGDDDGGGSFDAMAAAAPAQWPALQAEVQRVLDWAERRFGPAAPLEDGGEWDYALQGVREVATPLDVRYAPGAAQLELHPGEEDEPRITLSLTVSGSAAFCAAFREAFALD